MGQRKRVSDTLIPLVRTAFAVARLSELTDGELLARFTVSRDENAFGELVRRLGPTVFGVCRSVLGNAADAEDAFQVTFMVLARKAATVRPPGRVAAWLHGVAMLAARKARAARVRRAAREGALDGALDPAAPMAAPEPDLVRVVHEELARLPDKYRLPLVLCELRELTVAQAATELDWPTGTVASRLSRGRALLAARLRRRGVSGALIAGTLAQVATAAPPVRLVGSTVSAADLGGACPATVPPPLVNEVLRAMTMTKVRLLGLGLLVALAVGLGGLDRLHTATVAAAPAPEPKAKAAADKDPLDRVNVEDVAGLLKVETVQKEVGLTGEQKQKLNDLRAEAKTRKKAALQMQLQRIGQGVVPPGGNIDFGLQGGPDPELDQAMTKELKPEQLRRLKQIAVQAMGPGSLLDRRVIRALGLTADQEDKIDAHVRGLPRPNPNMRVVQMVGGQVMNGITGKIDAAWTAALEALTPEQRTKWDALVGKQLPTEELQKIHAGPDLNELLNDLKDQVEDLKGALPPGGIPMPGR